MRSIKLVTVALFCVASTLVAEAKLEVKVSEPKTTGKKALIKLELKNTFTEKIESARAVVFLLDDQGKVVGQMTRWVIGGTKDKPALVPRPSSRPTRYAGPSRSTSRKSSSTWDCGRNRAGVTKSRTPRCI